MATVRNTLALQDKMTPVLRSVIKALNSTVVAMASMDNVSNNAFKKAKSDIQAATQALDNMENQLKGVGNAAGGAAKQFTNFKNPLVTLSSGLYSAQMIMQGISKITGLSDTLVSTQSRLNLMNDGLQTTAQLQNMIKNSADASRSSYTDTAAVVAKLGILAGQNFSSNKEMVAFAELMNKQFKIGGASIQEQTSAMYQLTQAMAAGKLQGDEFRSIIENAPMLAKAIATYTGKSMGELKEMSSEGAITADIIKNAMFATAAETNAQFEKMPVTFGQAMTLIKNELISTTQPMFTGMAKGAAWIAENWQNLVPIFLGVASAVGIYALATGIATAVTWLQVAANRALMISMMTNPITIMAIAIGALIGIIYKWIQSVGGIAVAWVIAKNAILNVVDALSSGVLRGIQWMVNKSIDYLNDFISALNLIPGVNMDLIQKVTFGTEAAAAAKANKAARAAEVKTAKAEAAAKKKESETPTDFTIAGGNIDTVGKVKGDVKITEEDIKMLKDIAATEFINKYTTMTPNMQITFGDVRETADVGKILSTIETMIEEAYASSLVGGGDA